MPAQLRPTLRQVFALSLAGLVLGLLLLFYLIFQGSRNTILKSSGQLSVQAADEVIHQVTDYLNEAPMTVTHFEEQVKYGLVNVGDPASIQASLQSLLLANGNISEASFTFASSRGDDADGSVRVDPGTAGQVSIYRTADGRGLSSRLTRFNGKEFVSKTAMISRAGSGSVTAGDAETPAMDPTKHLTFVTPARKDFRGRLLWTDLHWSQLDAALPEENRRVEMSVQKSIENPRREFAGVLRIGLMKEQIDRAVKQPFTDSSDPHVVFICDHQGRLITGLDPRDRIKAEPDDELRVSAGHLQPQIAAALHQPALASLQPGGRVTNSFALAGKSYLYTFRAWPENETQDWIVGIVVPAEYYLGPLERIQRRVLWVSITVIGAIIVIFGLIQHSIGRAHSLVVRETSRMNAFEFSPSVHSSRLRDIGEVLAGLERAKTAMRAMGKYVPLDLVKRLYHDGREPELGGEAVELSVLFTDIRGFTTFAEANEPDKVAETLGRYLHVIATVIQEEKGTIDKYIGDSVMAFWNAPEKIDCHAHLACGAALKCIDALRTLYGSPEWLGAPHFETRFGLHECTAYVGHFGSPNRFNYTAIGDGINLASRLEGLNNHYGTAIIASENIEAAARDAFEFRLLDRVAVKGKTQGIAIHELLGPRGKESRRTGIVLSYERALGLYMRREFNAALEILETQAEDPPSRALAARCREYGRKAPGEDWNGVRVFETK